MVFHAPDGENGLNGASPTNGNGHASAAGPQLVLTNMAGVQPESVRWAWRDRVVLGMLNVIVGEPGLGKSTLAYDLAAKLSRGKLDGNLYGHPTNVLVVTYEDHLASKVRPVLEAAEADLELVDEVAVKQDETKELLTLPNHLELIRQAIESTRARLLIVDPIVASLPGEINSHRDQDVRRVLAPLSQMAEQYDVAVVVVMHVNKSASKQFFQRVGGSIGFTGAARSMLLVARDPEDPEEERGQRRVLAHGKCNVGALAPALLFEMEPVQLTGSDVRTVRLHWLGEYETTTADLLGGDSERANTEDVIEWLTDELTDGEWHASRKIKLSGKAQGITEKMIRRAREHLGVEHRREGLRAVSEWRLPVVPSVVPSSNGGGKGTTGNPSASADDSPSPCPQSCPVSERGTTDHLDKELDHLETLTQAFKEEFGAEVLDDDQWAEFECTHNVETWDFT